MDLDTLLHSSALLPVLAVLVLMDAPFPMVPSEPALMSAYGLAVGEHAWLLVAGLFGTALVGAVSGDLVMWRLGRCTRRVPADNTLTRWVAANVEHRPGAVLIGARFLPGGRLVSTLAAGRFGMPLRRFLPWSLLTSAVWALYMLLAGLVLAPFIDGDPVRGIVAGLAMAAAVGGLVALVRRVRAWRAAQEVGSNQATPKRANPRSAVATRAPCAAASAAIQASGTRLPRIWRSPATSSAKRSQQASFAATGWLRGPWRRTSTNRMASTVGAGSAMIRGFVTMRTKPVSTGSASASSSAPASTPLSQPA